MKFTDEKLEQAFTELLANEKTISKISIKYYIWQIYT